MDSDMAREEEQISKIRELIKTRNKKRNPLKAPHPKRRKLDETSYVARQDQNEMHGKNAQEKRKQDAETVGECPVAKKRKTRDIRVMLSQPKVPSTEPEPEPERELEPVQEEKRQEQEGANMLATGIYHGQEQEVELVDWEEIFKNHIAETRRLENERIEKKERSEKKEKIWELLRECTRFLKENEKTWKIEEHDRKSERQQKEDKNKRLQIAKSKTSNFQTRTIQQKITQTLKLLPEHERRKVLAEEEKRRKFELREAKINMWKK